MDGHQPQTEIKPPLHADGRWTEEAAMGGRRRSCHSSADGRMAVAKGRWTATRRAANGGAAGSATCRSGAYLSSSSPPRAGRAAVLLPVLLLKIGAALLHHSLLFYSSDWLLLVFCFSAAPEVSCGWTVVQHRFFI